MRVLYQIPSLESIYAIRTIYHGYKNAFESLGHIFQPLVASNNCKETLDKFNPDILFTSIMPYYLKYLDLKSIKKHKENGMIVFVAMPFWRSILKKNSIIEGRGLFYNKNYIKLIISEGFGDIYYNVYEPDDPRMEGFEKITGYKHYTIPLAVDKVVLKEKFDEIGYCCDVPNEELRVSEVVLDEDKLNNLIERLNRLRWENEKFSFADSKKNQFRFIFEDMGW